MMNQEEFYPSTTLSQSSDPKKYTQLDLLLWCAAIALAFGVICYFMGYKKLCSKTQNAESNPEPIPDLLVDHVDRNNREEQHYFAI